MATPDSVHRRVIAGRWEYDTRALISKGNNALTYEGRDLQTGKEVVVKIFSDAGGGRGHERFLREARLHKELKHYAILELLDQGSDAGVDYIVTPMLQPGALATVVPDRLRLSPAATLAIGTRIADALAYMHGRKEVHGDLSPGNILLNEKEDAYLADFGFSKRVATVPVATSGERFATRGFSLPREHGARRTYEDDVYGLAAVLWFCLTGDSPGDSPRARRRELSRRVLRAPLNRVLDLESGSIPTAQEFKQSLKKHWSKAGRDWRAVSEPQRRSRVPVVVAAGVVALVAAGIAGQGLKPKPATAATTTIDGGGVTLNLAGEWESKQAPSLPALRMRTPIAAASNSSVVVVGRASSAGQQLIAPAARASLPPAARSPQLVVVGEHPALRYASATRIGVTQEILALPLERDVLVVRCSGSASALPKVCAQAAADLELRDGSVQPLAPTAATARQLRAATNRLSAERRRQRSLLASTSSKGKLSAIAEELAGANRAFANRIAAMPATAQDAKSLGAAEDAARQTAAAYADLARASANSAWSTALARIDQRERQLEAKIRRLGALRVYTK
jgi:serine/threonine protein kinase